MFRLSRCMFILTFLAMHVHGQEDQIQFTVLMNVHGRQDDLAPWLEQYLEHPRIAHIVLQTNNGFKPDVADIGSRLGRDVSNVAIAASSRDSLNDRFLPFDAQTDALLVVDDDLLWLPREPSVESSTCPSSATAPHFEDLFDHYIANPADRQRLIGFTRRGALRDNEGALRYAVPLESCNKFHLVLTNAAVLPASLLTAYWADSKRLAAARDVVDKWMNCEDVLMNFVAANTTGLSPLALGRDGQCSELLDVSALRQSFPEGNFGPSSLSGRPQHFTQRTECLRLFTEQVFALSLPNGLPVADTSNLHQHCGMSAAGSARSMCPVYGFDHRRTVTLAHHLGSAPGGTAAAADCMRHASEVGPVVEGRMRDFGLLSAEPQFDSTPLRFSAQVG